MSNLHNKIKLLSLLLSFFILTPLVNSYDVENRMNDSISVPLIHAQRDLPLFGMNMRGYYTAMPQERDFKFSVPENYYEDSFKALSDAGIKFVRYLFFWESYERDPISFMNELKSVADTAEKWGISVLYANDQYDTSSWLGPKTATGFPSLLFENDPSSYPYGTGGGIGPKDDTAKRWWNNWLNRSVADEDGNDGWTLQAEFLKKIVNAVDDYTSTLGYEILNEPHVDEVSQWEKIGVYNSFMTDELRTVTHKTIFYDRQVPSELDGPVQASPQNMAKMAPASKDNVIFKATIFGLPTDSSYAESRLHYYAKAAQLAGVPLCICEFNLRSYGNNEIGEDENVTMTQENLNLMVEKINELNVWGLAPWVWTIKEHTNPNYNFVDFGEDGMNTTENFGYLRNAILNIATDVRDTISPAIYIALPQISSDKKQLYLQGYSFDVGSGIKSVQVHTNDGEYVPVTPVRHNDWSHWEAILPLDIDKSQTIVGLAIDNAGNKEYTTLPLNLENEPQV